MTPVEKAIAGAAGYAHLLNNHGFGIAVHTNIALQFYFLETDEYRALTEAEKLECATELSKFFCDVVVQRVEEAEKRRREERRASK